MLLVAIAVAARSYLRHHYELDDAGDFPVEPPSAPSYTAVVVAVADAVDRDSRTHRCSKRPSS